MYGSSDSEFCHNCGIRLNGRFCSACGQKALPLNVTVHDFFHDFTHELIHVDGRIFQSIRRLLMSPGLLTREYLQGHRARWISPIRLYLIFSVMFFAVSAVTPLDVTISRPARERSGWDFSIRRAPVSVGAGDDQEVAVAVQGLGYKNLDELQQAVNRAWVTWTPRVMFALVPLFAWLVAKAYRRVDNNYLHHLIFALHLHAAWFAAGAVAAGFQHLSFLLGEALQIALIVYMVAYAMLALNRVYGKVRWSLTRRIVVLGLYGVAVIAAVLAIILPVALGRIPRPPS